MSPVRKIVALFRKRKLDAEMAEEMRLHIEMLAERNRAAGMELSEARYAAQREFGNVSSIQERAREVRCWMPIERIWRDVCFGLRQLVKSPGFTFVAVATIAIGIGAGTAVFSLVNAILLRSLPVPDPQELCALRWSGSEVRMRSYNGNNFAPEGKREVHDSVNHPTFQRLRERAAGTADVFGYFPSAHVTMITPNGASAVDGLMVSDNFFSGLGVGAFIGRVFEAGDDAAARPQVVITHGLWQRQFGGNSAVLGQAVTMLGTSYTIVGVLPARFPGIQPGMVHDFYVAMSPGSPFLYVPLTDEWHWFIRMMARLQPGHAESELAEALSPVFAAADPKKVTDGRIEVVPGRGGLGFDRELYGRPLVTMLGVTALVMLIACANLAGLSLARGAAREHELAVRAALGAGRLRLVGQAFTESMILAGLGCGLGIVLSHWGRDLLGRLLAGAAEGLHYDLSLDARVVAFSCSLALTTALLAGLLPALRAGRIDPVEGLRSRGAGKVPRLRIGRWLVAAQICLALSILTVAGLGLRSLLNLRRINPGFSPDNVIVFSLNPSSAGYDRTGLLDFHRRAQASVAALPGVEGVTVMDYAPLSGRGSSGGFRFHGDNLPGGEYRSSRRQAVGAGFFSTLGIPVLKGRAIAGSDGVDAPKVVVVNETFAKQCSPERDPIGRSFDMWDASWRIVGVCADSKLASLKEHAEPTIYFAFAQRFYGRFRIDQTTYAVRSRLPAGGQRRPIEQAIAAISPDVPVTAYATENALLDRTIGRERMLAVLCAILAGVALSLCCIGLFGLIAYDVTRRLGEFAIRMAIGARPVDVARPIVREALVLALIGIGLGLPVTWGLERLVRHQLYGVEPNDPAIMALVILALVLVAVAAAGIPARRATKVDPMVALRCE